MVNEDDILVFTDANIIFEPETIFHLIKHFKDPRVAQVGAKVINRGMNKEGISFQENFYISRENEIKYNEGKAFGTMMGAFGACFAHKASLYETIPKDHVVDDFYLTMSALSKGYDCILSKDAICYEDLPNNIEVEYKRKKRISIGNFQNMAIFGKTLIPKRPALSFCFFSHKVLRWLSPFFIIISLITIVILAKSSFFYNVLMFGLLTSFAIPLIDKVLQKAGIHLSIFRFITYFYSMNLALLHGFYDFITGRNQNIWDPTERVV